MKMLVDQDGVIELREIMTPGRRLVFLLLSFFPLLAPYQLILRPHWDSYFNFFFILSLAISLGALSLTAFLIYAAIAGLSSSLRFDPAARVLTYTRQAPIVPLRREQISFHLIDKVEVEEHDWSDGGSTFSIKVSLEGGRSFKSGSVWHRAEAEEAYQRVKELLALT